MARAHSTRWSRRLLAAAVATTAAVGALAFAPSPAGAAGTPSISVGDASIHEGATGTRVIRVMVTLDRVADVGVSTRVGTIGASATSGVDFKARAANLYFKPGQTTRYVKIVVKPDALVEGDEQFSVMLNTVVGATIGDALGVATIVDDEATTGAAASIGDAAVVEGLDGNSRYVFFSVTLNQPAGVSASVSYATGGGTAVTPFDYSDRSGTLTFTPRMRVRYVLVYITPDEVADGTKTFDVTLSAPVNVTIADGVGTGTIVDDD